MTPAWRRAPLIIMADDIEVVDLVGQLKQWRQGHPKRDNDQLVEASRGLPTDLEKQTAGLVYSPARRAAGGTASGGVPSAASGAPPSDPYFEIVCLPFSQVIPVDKSAVEAPEGSYLTDGAELFAYTDDDSGEIHQHTTSIQRMLVLARTHPLVHTIDCIHVRNVLDEREEDDKGRVTSGHQSSFELSLSLVETGMVFRVGLRTKSVRPEFFALHWRTTRTGWKLDSWSAARNVFFDLIERPTSLLNVGSWRTPAERFRILSVPLAGPCWWRNPR